MLVRVEPHHHSRQLPLSLLSELHVVPVRIGNIGGEPGAELVQVRAEGSDRVSRRAGARTAAS